MLYQSILFGVFPSWKNTSLYEFSFVPVCQVHPLTRENVQKEMAEGKAREGRWEVEGQQDGRVQR